MCAKLKPRLPESPEVRPDIAYKNHWFASPPTASTWRGAAQLPYPPQGGLRQLSGRSHWPNQTPAGKAQRRSHYLLATEKTARSLIHPALLRLTQGRYRLWAYGFG